MNKQLIKRERCVDYNDEPVYYCKQCLSLRVMSVDDSDDMCFCDTCNAVTIDKTTIDEWMRMYKEKYGFDYLNNIM